MCVYITTERWKLVQQLIYDTPVAKCLFLLPWDELEMAKKIVNTCLLLPSLRNTALIVPLITLLSFEQNLFSLSPPPPPFPE